MDMLLRNISITDLAGIFARHRDRSPAPYLTDPKSVSRARRLAKANGVWDDLTQNLDATQDIPVIKRSAYRNFQRVGDRGVPQAASGRRSRELGRAAMALWLDHPKADVDYLQDLLWAYCDDWTWVMAAHEGRAIDLGSAAKGATFAEILYVLGDRLEEEVKVRVSKEIDRQIFQKFWNYKHLDSWKTVRMNWNHVCNGEIIRAALYEIDDPAILAHMTHAAIQNLTYALDGFTDDGGCEEGPGYWGYGFGHYLYVAYALYLKTNGELNIMTDEKVERISRYPLAAQISGPLRSTFADSSHGYTSPRAAMIINEFYKIPELYDSCDLHPDRTLKVSGMHDMAMYKGQKARGAPDQQDYFLPDLGQVKLRGKAGKKQITLMALAGNNGVPHNHNDIGSFIVHRGGRLLLVDPGGPVYSRKTFSAHRYEIIFCNSLGHSVPLINGKQQQPGGNFRGAIQAENLNGGGEKRAAVDMTQAYPEGTVKSLVRTFALDTDANRLTVEDVYAFSREPRSLEEAFITFEGVKVLQNGRSVQIGPKNGGVVLSAPDTPGEFSFKRLVEESKEGRGNQVITRITFIPEELSKGLVTRFVIA